MEEIKNTATGRDEGDSNDGSEVVFLEEKTNTVTESDDEVFTSLISIY